MRERVRERVRERGSEGAREGGGGGVGKGWAWLGHKKHKEGSDGTQHVPRAPWSPAAVPLPLSFPSPCQALVVHGTHSDRDSNIPQQLTWYCSTQMVRGCKPRILPLHTCVHHALKR